MKLFRKRHPMLPKRDYWKSFKFFILKRWYKYILGREYRIGWRMMGPNIVILNDEAILSVNISGEYFS